MVNTLTLPIVFVLEFIKTMQLNIVQLICAVVHKEYQLWSTP